MRELRPRSRSIPVRLEGIVGVEVFFEALDVAVNSEVHKRFH